MTIQYAKKALRELQAKMSAYDHAMSLLYYDGATTAPRGTAANRGQSMAILSEEAYKLATGKKTINLLELLDANKSELDEMEQRQVYLLLKDIRKMQKIPMKEYVAWQKLLVDADAAWHTAKEQSDFELFRPCLEQIFETNIRFAGYCAPEKHPYDYCLGEFEDGLTMEVCDRFFARLRERLVPLLQKIAACPQVDDTMLWGEFPEDAQEKLSCFMMEHMGLDLDHVGLSVTEHPFTTSLGSHLDERITTHYHVENFASSMYSVIHESGHALYDTGSREELAYTCLDGGCSMGIHESQSRFYENILCRSRSFAEWIFPELCSLFPQMKSHTAEEFYRAINKAQPSLIRTEADEITYSLHVMVRYELEKRVMSGKLAVRDLPAAWNALYQEYLGVEVPDDRHGVLQDSHWSGGSIGYFPSYALGSAYGAQFLRKMQSEVDIDACMRCGDFAPINEWNRVHIWQHGKFYTSDVLLEKVLEEPFDPDVYLDYLETKAKDVYGF